MVAKFDVCVIGAGPAGFAAAMRAWDYGKKVCLVEKSTLGGAGVYDGVLFSKTLWELSRDYINAKRTNRGFFAEDVSVDFKQVLHCTKQALEEKIDQLETQLEALSEPRGGFEGSVTLMNGHARFLSTNRIYVDSDENTHSGEVQAEYFIIATGSRPRVLDSIPVDGRNIITSDHLMDLEEFPRSLVVVGGGVVGCEFATIFANYGHTKVYVIDRQDRILPFEDEDISRLCSKNLERKGVTIHHQCQLLSIEVVDDIVEYTIQHHTGGRETIRVDKALVSIGRVPNTDDLWLDNTGVKLHESGHVADDKTKTAVKNIFAVGDITMDKALYNVGELEGRHAIESIYGEVRCELNYDNVSSIVFLDPELAAIGINEQQAQEQKIPYQVAVYGYSLVNRAIAMRATEGFVKLLVTPDDDMKILGMRALGVHASSTIEAVSLMMQHNRSARELGEVVHPHPAITEGVQDCVRMLEGTSIYKPHVFNTDLRLSTITYEEPAQKTKKAAKDSDEKTLLH